MRSELEKLIQKLSAYLSLRGGRLSAKDLINWSEDEGINLLILQMLISEMKSRGIIRVSKENELIEISQQFSIEIPKEIYQKSYKIEQKVTKGKTQKKIMKTKVKGVPSLMEFLEIKKKEKIKRKVVQKEKKKEIIKPKEVYKIEKKEEKREDIDLEKAIDYLNTYWSVGEIRLMLDLKMMGIKRPEKVLEKLLKLGYVERSPLGVINATDKLPKRRKEKTISELIFS